MKSQRAFSQGSGGSMEAKPLRRCSWAQTDLSIAYHDREWGLPVHDDRVLFEFLILEGAQAGLSWETILNRRENYRAAFNDFDFQAVAQYGPKKERELLANEGIIRNRLKITAAIQNARSFMEVRDEFGSFDHYVWTFVDGSPRQNSWKAQGQVPARTPESEALSRDLLRRGFKFVGPTICYAFMQAVGLVNDHLIDCFRHDELRKTNSAGTNSSPSRTKRRRA
jgi:DNA-3-methyladenine glycosylase I